MQNVRFEHLCLVKYV